ncbi:MAG: alpha/beta hydrolase [Thiotrichales bacterium]
MILRVLIVVWMLALTGCSRLFFIPDSMLVLRPDDVGLAFDDVVFPSSDNAHQLHGWFLGGAEPVKGTVLFLHGNAQNISYHLASVRWLPARHFNVFLYDYRGFGASGGRSTIANAIADAPAAMAALRTRIGHADDRIAVFGQSLGGALSVAAVARHRDEMPVKAVILDSSFSGFQQIAREKLEEAWLTRPLSGVLATLFPNEPDLLAAANAIHPIPILLIHGLDDRIVPATHSQQLFEAAREPKTLLLQPGARHISALASAEVRERLVSFLTAAMCTAMASTRVPECDASSN